MLDTLTAIPGRLYVVATLLPLAAFALLLLAGTVRALAGPPYRRPGRGGAYLVLAAMAASAALGVTGLVTFLNDPAHLTHEETALSARWSERVDWVRVGRIDPTIPGSPALSTPALALELGYRIDHLTALLFAMITVVGTLIVLFSLGYMAGETEPTVEDHEVDRQAHARRPAALGGGHDTTPPLFEGERPPPHPTHFHRRGRFGRFFLYLALFAFSMLNLVIADNLLQIFVGWELVGVCSFFLIGFNYERPSAARAATKAFLMNRVGDAGFLVAILIAWSAFGTLNVRDIASTFAGGPPPMLSYPLWIVMGVGLFLGCVGKSAQMPLHTWLPDAMEGPTPVSALIHAATMVAAGVYLVGRCYALFAPEVLLGIAYTGAVTLFVAATIALVQTDIKRVLAFSTVSQLGYMMLALGVGGWVAGLLHLLTHAFFKALLFLGAGSVIHGCHHEQDLRRMGGLAAKMRVTAATMLVGVLAIAGTPLLSGWYSKDQVLNAALAFAHDRPEHLALFVLPLVTAGLTAFYMARLWFLAFTGTPRDRHVFDHAAESPPVMTLPLVVLAAFSVGVAWGWPPWDADASYLGKLLHESRPSTVADAGGGNHLLAGGLALLAAASGFGFAALRYWKRETVPSAGPPSGARRFLLHKWYFDELYDRVFVRPAVTVSRLAGAFDKRPTGDAEPARSRVDGGTLDGWLNAVGQGAAAAGRSLRRVQTGRLRGYVLVLALTAVAMLGILTALAG